MARHARPEPGDEDAPGHARHGHRHGKGREPGQCYGPRRPGMRGFRTALKKYGATAREAFDGSSGYHADGRWHSRGRYLDYAAKSRSLATLERLVHYKRFDCVAPH